MGGYHVAQGSSEGVGLSSKDGEVFQARDASWKLGYKKQTSTWLS